MKHLKLIRLRKERGLSQEEVGAQAGLSRMTVSTAESGRQVGFKAAKKLESFFSVRLYNVSDDGRMVILEDNLDRIG